MSKKKENQGREMAMARWAPRYELLKEISKHVSDKALLDRIQTWPTKFVAHLLDHYRMHRTT